MRIGFRLSVDDYVAFNVYHVRSSPSYRRGLIVWGLMVPLGLFVVLSVLGFKESPVFSIVSAAIPSGLLILWAWGGNDGRLRKSAQKMYSEGENRGLGGWSTWRRQRTGSSVWMSFASREWTGGWWSGLWIRRIITSFISAR